MATYKIEEVEGIGPILGAKFQAAGIATTEELLIRCKTPKQRQELAVQVDLMESKILKFANMVDLFRIKGIGSEFSELLEAAGVDTVPELAQRNAENLTARMESVNEAKKLTRRTPTLNEVTSWIDQAKALPRVLEY